MDVLRSSAGRATALLLASLALASLLDAEGLRKQAVTQPQGLERDVALAATRPLLAVSRALHLTLLRREVQDAIGRSGADTIDTRVRLAPPPRVGVHATPPTATNPAHRPPAAGRSRRPAAPTFSRAHRLTVWVAGDSLAQVPGEGLERVAGANIDVLPVESRLSTGLARPDLYNWFSRFQALLAGARPDVAVLSFGADDAHDELAGVPAGRTVGPFGSPSWRAEYRRRVDGVTRELNAAGIRTIWLGLPIPDGPGFRRSFPVMNAILAAVAHAHRSQSQFVDTWDLLAGAHGRYTPYLRVGGKLTLMRLPDGIHYTAAAGDLIARSVLGLLRADYRLR